MADNWYTQMSGIEEKINDFQSTGLIDTNVYLSDVLSTRLNQLKLLREVIIQKEKEFYNSLSLTAPYQNEPAKAIEVLNGEIKKWNSSGAEVMISNKSVQTVLEILTNKDYRRITTQEINQLIQDLFVSEQETFNEVSQEVISAKLTEVLNEVLRSAGQATLPKTQRDRKTPHVYFKIEQNNGKTKIEINSNLDSTKKAQLKKAVRLLVEELDQQNKTNKAEIFSDSLRNALLIQNVILSKITNNKVKEAIKQELSPGKIERFNLARDFNVIKGFLGEVYWSAFFSYLGAKTTPTGDEKDITSGQSIAIDLLINNFGFQVKNFNFKPDGKIQFGTRGKYKTAGTFVKDRAGVDGKLGELMLLLYGSYAYNIDISDGEFTDTREKLEHTLVNDASEILTYYIDSVLRLDAEQETELTKATEGIIPNRKLLFNTFFLIGDKIIPSSAILTEIIKNLDKATNAPNINFEITGIRYDENSPKYYTKNLVWDSLKMANHAEISYLIDFNIVDILNQAYAAATK